MNRPRVSVIVCAYDAAETIAETLDSLLTQTSTEFEIVVVDDGSTDSTPAVVERFAQDSSRAVRLVGMAHGGLARARNRGIEEGAGEFFAFVDADDAVAPEMIERMLACADELGADLVVCEMQYVDFESGSALHVSREGDSSLYGGSLLERPGLLAELGGSVCNKLIHRSLFEKRCISFPDGRIFEDLWVAYRLCGEARFIAKVSEPLYRYRVGREGSIVSQYDLRYLEIVDALVVTNGYFIEKGDFGQLFGDLMMMNYVHLIYGRFTNLLSFGSRAVRHRYLARAFAHMDCYFPGWRSSAALQRTSGSAIKHFVLTHRAPLILYTDMKAARARR